MAHTTTNTLILIPDISGFSSFVNEVALRHSEHIIRELLEIIMKCNTLHFKVSEIEGDAVLFYKQGEFPQPAQMLEMVKQTFISFQEHLLLYERNRICQCGACRTAHQLTLKVVADMGHTSNMNVGKHRKLVGPALIGAHRLLKNNVPSHEYFLVSENYLQNYPITQWKGGVAWPQWKEDAYEYDIGTVPYWYALLTPLRQKIRKPEERQLEFSVKYPLILTKKVKVDYREAFQVLSDSTQKEHWVKGIKKVVRQSQEEIERIGSKHLCIFPGRKLEFEAKHKKEKEGELEFMETVQNLGLLKNVAILYRSIQRGAKQCKIVVEIHYDAPILLKPFKWFLLLFARQNMGKSLVMLKKHLEQGGAKMKGAETKTMPQTQ